MRAGLDQLPARASPVAETVAPNRLRVAMITTFYPPLNFGGDGRYVRRLAQALARRGVEVEVVHDADAWRVLSSSSKPEPDVLPEPPGVTVHRLRSRFATGSVLVTHQTGLPLVQGKAIERILARGFDVIHYHNVSLIGGPGVLALGDAIKLYTAHEHWLVCPTHVLWRHNRELCTSRECVRCSVTYARPPQVWRATDLLDRAARHVDVFIALSRSVAENHRAFGFTRPMTLMGSFLPDSEAVPSSAPPPPNARPYFLFAGRLQPFKGVQDVIPHFGTGMPADLVIAGTGSYEPELRRLAGDNPAIRFVGHQSSEALRALYRGAVALVTPSLCYEVFPMVVLEAFREGTPIVTRDLGPYPEIVEQSGGGVLFGDAASLDAALRRLLAQPRERDALGARGRDAVRTRWSERTAVEEYLALVKETALLRGRSEVARKVDALTARAEGTSVRATASS